MARNIILCVIVPTILQITDACSSFQFFKNTTSNVKVENNKSKRIIASPKSSLGREVTSCIHHDTCEAISYNKATKQGQMILDLNLVLVPDPDYMYVPVTSGVHLEKPCFIWVPDESVIPDYTAIGNKLYINL